MALTYYAGNVVYKNDKTPEYVINPEGIARKSAIGYDYQFNITDHLGNVRVVTDINRNSIQTNNYYPFGLTHINVVNTAKTKMLYAVMLSTN